MGDRIDQFSQFRTEMNERILATGTLETKRFFSLDGAVYRDGALPAKTKELLGLVASMVLRCNDCITYHVLQCYDAGATREELVEAFDVALIVGGSIVIPHVRHAHAILKELDEPSARAQGERSESRSERGGSPERSGDGGGAPSQRRNDAPRTDEDKLT